MRVSADLRRQRLRDNPTAKDNPQDVKRARSFGKTTYPGNKGNPGFRMMLPAERIRSGNGTKPVKGSY